MLRIHEQLPISDLESMNDIHIQEMQLITKLHTAAEKRDTKAVLELLNELIKDTKQHFASEEKMMEDAEYPDFHSHKHEHMMQLLDLQSMLSFYEMTNDTNSVYTYVEDTLTTWIKEHVYNWDIPASEFLTQ